MFYRNSDILITSTHVVVLHPQERRFRLEEISAPYVVDHGRGAGFRVGREIRARLGQADVRLYYSTNRATFGSVRRALIRALECRCDPLPL